VAKSHVPCVTSPRTGTFGHRKDLFPDHDSTASRVQDGLAKMPSITVTAVLIALFCADIVAAGNGGVHIYHGKDPAKWRTYAMATSSSGTLIYTGGEYPISIVKTSVDSAGNTYTIGGWVPAFAPASPDSNSPQPNVLHDVFVSKINPAGALEYATYLSGRGDNTATEVAVDSGGNLYGVGYTTAPDFPLQNALQSSTSTTFSTQTGFIFKLDASGALLWSTYFGGSGPVLIGSAVNAVALDGSGNVYVTGTSGAANFPTTPGAFQTNGNVSNNAQNPAASAFVSKISPAGNILYSTWLGGSQPNCIGGSQCTDYSRQDSGVALAVDGAGAAYVAGYTDSTDFPATTAAFQTACNCLYGSPGRGNLASPFVVKLKPDGTGLIYGTYLGSLYTGPELIAIDSSGDAYVAGGTTSTQFPTTPGVLQAATGGGTDVFVSALNPTGTALVFSTYLGGTGDDSPTGLAIDGDGDVFLSGTTSSPNFPDSYGVFPSGASFLAEFTPGAKTIAYSMRLPAGAADQDVGIDSSSGGLVTAGSSGYIMYLSGLNGKALPPILGIGNSANQGVDDALSPGEIVSIYGTGLGPSTPVMAQPSSGVFPTSVAGVQVFFNNVAAPLLYVSASQINTVDSANLFTGPVTVKVVYNGSTIGELTLPQVANMPGIFRNGASAAAVNQDGAINSATNPAKSGSIVSIWATGVMGYDQGSGEIATVAGNLYNMVGPVQLLTGVTLASGVPVAFGVYQVEYAGPAPGLITAAFQINLQLSCVTAPTLVPVSLLAGGVVSPVVSVFVAP
jgi:uncharacterized protein (TIGR03437 family)